MLSLMTRKGTPVTVAVGRRIEAARRGAGYETMREFAALLGITEQRYRRYEAGEVQAPYEILIRIAEISGRSLDFILRNAIDRPLPKPLSAAATKTS